MTFTPRQQTHIALSGERVPCHATKIACPRKGHQPAFHADLELFKQDVELAAKQKRHRPAKTARAPRRPKTPMFLHGTNMPLAKGTVIVSAKERNAKTAYSQSDAGAVYATYTDWAKGAEAEAATDLHNPMWRHEENEAAGIDAPTMALASAMRYGVNTASNRGIHASSRSQLLESHMIDGVLDGDDDVSAVAPKDADIERFNRNAPQEVPKMITDAEYNSLSRDEQDAFNDNWQRYEKKNPPKAPPLRGYWVYKVEPVKGDVAADLGGQATSDMVIEDGALRIVDVIVWDGVLVSDEFDAPPSLATYPEEDEEDTRAVAAWRNLTAAA